MKLSLIKDWSTLWHQLWSIRLALAAAGFSVVEAVWTAYTTGQTPVATIITGLVALAAAASRLVVQDDLKV